MVKAHDPERHTYLLRCWREQVGGKWCWRFFLQEVGGQGGRWGFGDLEALFAFLRTHLSAWPERRG